jgi:two-component system cell cycle sensor histidine kinase/response regulator CckA
MEASPIRILVVDDEASLLNLMRVFLGRLGYQVDVASNASNALSLFQTSIGQFRLVIADLTMPEMAGDQMALKMTDIDPNVRVLLCSGYPYDVQSLPVKVRDRFGMLQKPFVPKMLEAAVKGLLT